MTIETHTIKTPAWIGRLVEHVQKAMTPHEGGFLGPLGYSWCEPHVLDNIDAAWIVCVYPTPNVMMGGPRDGSRYVYGFNLDVTQILRKMRQIRVVEWKSPHGYNGELDGPSVGIRGVFDDVEVWLRVFNLPPSDERPGCRVDGLTGRVQVVG